MPIWTDEDHLRFDIAFALSPHHAAMGNIFHNATSCSKEQTNTK